MLLSRNKLGQKNTGGPAPSISIDSLPAFVS